MCDLPERRYEGEEVSSPPRIRGGGEEMEFEGDLEAEARRSAGGSALPQATGYLHKAAFAGAAVEARSLWRVGSR